MSDRPGVYESWDLLSEAVEHVRQSQERAKLAHADFADVVASSSVWPEYAVDGDLELVSRIVLHPELFVTLHEILLRYGLTTRSHPTRTTTTAPLAVERRVVHEDDPAPYDALWLMRTPVGYRLKVGWSRWEWSR